MSIRIQFSHIFNETLERVYECFQNFNLCLEVPFKHLYSNAKRIKGFHFDEVGSEFEYVFKNYYNIKLKVVSAINTDAYKTYSHELNISELPTPLLSVQSFYWNSCEQTTIYTYEYLFDDSFFEALFKEEMSKEDKMKIAKNVEEYLKTSTNGLEQMESMLIKTPMLTLWSFVSNFENMFRICKSIKLKGVYNGDYLTIGTTVDMNSVETSNIVGCIVITNIFMSEETMEIQIESINKEVPKGSTKISCSKLSDDVTFLTVTHYSLEYVPPGSFSLHSKVKKRSFKELKDYLEKEYN